MVPSPRTRATAITHTVTFIQPLPVIVRNQRLRGFVEKMRMGEELGV